MVRTALRGGGSQLWSGSGSRGQAWASLPPRVEVPRALKVEDAFYSNKNYNSKLSNVRRPPLQLRRPNRGLVSRPLSHLIPSSALGPTVRPAPAGAPWVTLCFPVIPLSPKEKHLSSPASSQAAHRPLQSAQWLLVAKMSPLWGWLANCSWL